MRVDWTLVYRNSANIFLFLQLSSAFSRWSYECLVVGRQKQNVMRRALSCFIHRQLNKTWSAWIDYVDCRQTNRLILKRAMHRLQNKTLTSSLSSWIQYIQEQKRSRLKVQRCIVRIRKTTLVAAFDAWVFKVKESLRIRNLLKRVAARIAMRNLSFSFNGWFDAVQVKVKNRLKVQRFLVRMQKQILVIALQAWIDTIEDIKVNRVLLQRASRRLQNKALSSSFLSWMHCVQDRVHLRKLIQKNVRRWKLANIECAFKNLLAFCHRQAMQEESNELYRLKQLTVRQKEHYEETQSEANHLMAEQHQRENQLKMQRCLLKIHKRKLNATFDGWVSKIHESKRMQNLLQRASLKLSKRKLSMNFRCWYNSVQVIMTEKAQNERQKNEQHIKQVLAELSLEQANNEKNELQHQQIIETIHETHKKNMIELKELHGKEKRFQEVQSNEKVLALQIAMKKDHLQAMKDKEHDHALKFNLAKEEHEALLSNAKKEIPPETQTALNTFEKKSSITKLVLEKKQEHAQELRIELKNLRASSEQQQADDEDRIEKLMNKKLQLMEELKDFNVNCDQLKKDRQQLQAASDDQEKQLIEANRQQIQTAAKLKGAKGALKKTQLQNTLIQEELDKNITIFQENEEAHVKMIQDKDREHAQAIQTKDGAHSTVVESKDQELNNAKKKINLSKVVLKKSQEHAQLLQDKFDSLLAASKLRQANDAIHTKDLEASLATLQNAVKTLDTELKEEKDRHAQAIQDKENSHVNALQERDDAHATVVKGKDRELKDHLERAQKLKEDVDHLHATSQHRQEEDSTRIKEVKKKLADAKSTIDTLETATKKMKEEYAKSLEKKEDIHAIAIQEKEELHGNAVQEKEKDHRRKMSMRTIVMARNHKIAKVFNNKRRHFLAWQRYSHLSFKDIAQEQLRRVARDAHKAAEDAADVLEHTLKQKEDEMNALVMQQLDIQETYVANVTALKVSIKEQHDLELNSLNAKHAYEMTASLEKHVIAMEEQETLHIQTIQATEDAHVSAVKDKESRWANAVQEIEQTLHLKHTNSVTELDAKHKESKNDHRRRMSMRTITMARNHKIAKLFNKKRSHFIAWRHYASVTKCKVMKELYSKENIKLTTSKSILNESQRTARDLQETVDDLRASMEQIQINDAARIMESQEHAQELQMELNTLREENKERMAGAVAETVARAVTEAVAEAVSISDTKIKSIKTIQARRHSLIVKKLNTAMEKERKTAAMEKEQVLQSHNEKMERRLNMYMLAEKKSQQSKEEHQQKMNALVLDHSTEMSRVLSSVRNNSDKNEQFLTEEFHQQLKVVNQELVQSKQEYEENMKRLKRTHETHVKELKELHDKEQALLETQSKDTHVEIKKDHEEQINSLALTHRKSVNEMEENQEETRKHYRRRMSIRTVTMARNYKISKKFNKTYRCFLFWRIDTLLSARTKNKQSFALAQEDKSSPLAAAAAAADHFDGKSGLQLKEAALLFFKKADKDGKVKACLLLFLESNSLFVVFVVVITFSFCFRRWNHITLGICQNIEGSWQKTCKKEQGG